jgi:photosystem II stability/assembly factor-like uncharacterized protein
MRNLQNLVTKYKTPDANFPDGSAKDDVVAGDKTGTELAESWVNELLQYAYAIIRNIGEVPNNVYEKPGTSQMVDTFQKWFVRNAIINYRILQSTGYAPTKMAISSDDIYFVACGNTGLIITSTFGESWNSETSGTTQNLYDIEYDFENGIFLIAGANPTILTATDPTSTWTSQTPPTNDTDYYGCAVSDDGDLYLVCGANSVTTAAISRSTNQGSSWAVATTLGTTNILRDILAGTGPLFAVGDNGTIVKSTDVGINWALEPGITSEDLLSVAYSPLLNRSCAVGTNETILTYDEGDEFWSLRTSPIGNSEDFNGVQWLDEANIFIITSTSGILLASDDGINWIRLVTDTAITLNDVIYNRGAGLAIVCGASGNVLQSHNVFP